MRSPLVSFVIPAFQPRADWLDEAISSVLVQRGCDVELIVVDDGSPEPVSELLDRDDERLRVVRIDHAGVSEALNAGIRLAHGDYLRFLGCDDVVEPESTARLLRLAAGRDDVIAYGALLVCDEQLRPIAASSWHAGLPILEYLRGRYDLVDCKPVGITSAGTRGDGVRDCLLGRFRAESPSQLFPRGVVVDAGAWHPLPIMQDWDFLLRALEHATVRGDRAVAARYRQHPHQTTRNAVSGLRMGSIVLDRYFDRHPELRGTALERQARARIELRVAGAYAFSSRAPFAVAGRDRQFVAHVRRAFVLDWVTTIGRLLLWSPWLVRRAARKMLPARLG
jgi:glycosyltransferase involved in cell wall biosynthesis